ncbi:MAG: hypothetical protein OEY34_00195 [Cyclobacteriaceae bacterium]|nr:hypothetical protein [Cyclobacteriaceae bacterium]
MIQSQPKPNTLFAISAFISLSLILFITGFRHALLSGGWAWYDYIAVYLFGPLSIGLFVRMIFNFKIIKINKDQITIRYPFRFTTYKKSLKSLEFWKEEEVKTGKTTFFELQMKWIGQNIKISNQEYTAYSKIVGLLKSRVGNKRI